MITQLRVLVAGTAVVAGMWFVTSVGDRGAVAAPPVLAKGTYKKAAEADIAQLQKHLEICIKDEDNNAKRYAPTAKSMAMILAAYAEATGDKNLRDGAYKAAGEIGKKDYKGALDTVKKLAVAPGDKPLAAAKGPKYELDEVMSPFRGGAVGGLNIEKDIRDIMNGRVGFDPAAVELIAARTAIITDYAIKMPNDKAAINPKNQALWDKMSKDTIELSKKLSDEASKGKGASEKEIIKMLKQLDARCSDCHNEFRD